MQKSTAVLIGLALVLLLVVPAFAIPIPGARNTSPQMIPVYDSGGNLISYVLDTSGGVQVSDTRMESVAKSKSGKPLWYKETVMQGTQMGISLETITTPYPDDWPTNLTQYTYLEYVDACIKNGGPLKRGTFAVNMRNGMWMR